MKRTAAIAVVAAMAAYILWPDRQMATGRALYAQHCASCHGADRQGQPDWQTPHPDGSLPAPPHDETGHTWHHDDTFLTDYILRGGQAVLDDLGVAFPSAMPGFADSLNPQDAAAILAYLKSHWPHDLRTHQAGLTRAQVP